MHIAQQRARLRRLENIIWVKSWIEGITFHGLGRFQHSQCSGVLHHLKTPFKGLDILKDTLTWNGGMQLMVYASYGRTAVYQMQRLLKVINRDKQTINGELANANCLLSTIPPRNYFLKSSLLGDHKLDDTDIYDMLCHKRDISYSTSDLYKLIATAGLNFVDFVDFKTRSSLYIKYTIYNKLVYGRIIYMDTNKQTAIAENIRGDMYKLSFFIAKEKRTEAALDDPSNDLYIYGTPYGFRKALLDKNNHIRVGNKTLFFVKMSETFVHSRSVKSTLMPFDAKIGYKAQSGSVSFGWVLNEFSMFLVKRLLDSNKGKSLSSLYSEYKKEINPNVTNSKLFELAEELYGATKHTGLFRLKQRYIQVFPKTYCISFFRIQSM